MRAVARIWLAPWIADTSSADGWCRVKDYDPREKENRNLKVEACLQDGAHGTDKCCNHTWGEA